MARIETESRRARQAAQTRRDILNAARRLFAKKGYAATTVAEIAAAAGASVQTIYDRVGSKAELVSALNDLIDEESDVGPLAGRIPGETDPRALLDIAVSITHNICRRCGDIIGAVYGAATASRAAEARGRACSTVRAMPIATRVIAMNAYTYSAPPSSSWLGPPPVAQATAPPSSSAGPAIAAAPNSRLGVVPASFMCGPPLFPETDLG